jgi:hypothetical protein
MAGVYSDNMVFDRILKSNIQKEEKSAIRQWFDKVSGGKASELIEKYQLEATPEKKVTIGQALVASTEGLGVGAALGAMHALLDEGLDVKVPMTDKHVPADAALGGMSMVAAVFSPVGQEHAKTVGISAFSVYGFRKFHDMLAAKRMSKIHGEEPAAASDNLADEEPAPADIGADPIVALADSLNKP